METNCSPQAADNSDMSLWVALVRAHRKAAKLDAKALKRECGATKETSEVECLQKAAAKLTSNIILFRGDAIFGGKDVTQRFQPVTSTTDTLFLRTFNVGGQIDGPLRYQGIHPGTKTHLGSWTKPLLPQSPAAWSPFPVPRAAMDFTVQEKINELRMRPDNLHFALAVTRKSPRRLKDPLDQSDQYLVSSRILQWILVNPVRGGQCMALNKSGLVMKISLNPALCKEEPLKALLQIVSISIATGKAQLLGDAVTAQSACQVRVDVWREHSTLKRNQNTIKILDGRWHEDQAAPENDPAQDTKLAKLLRDWQLKHPHELRMHQNRIDGPAPLIRDLACTLTVEGYPIHTKLATPSRWRFTNSEWGYPGDAERTMARSVRDLNKIMTENGHSAYFLSFPSDPRSGIFCSIQETLENEAGKLTIKGPRELGQGAMAPAAATTRTPHRGPDQPKQRQTQATKVKSGKAARAEPKPIPTVPRRVAQSEPSVIETQSTSSATSLRSGNSNATEGQSTDGTSVGRQSSRSTTSNWKKSQARRRRRKSKSNGRQPAQKATAGQEADSSSSDEHPVAINANRRPATKATARAPLTDSSSSYSGDNNRYSVLANKPSRSGSVSSTRAARPKPSLPAAAAQPSLGSRRSRRVQRQGARQRAETDRESADRRPQKSPSRRSRGARGTSSRLQ